ncbi:stage II sporulation protein R [Bhargavaea cecembensis]|uniref:stage II sporulation protein R n=1 Tax=Bhargavaea cecembensis TaxID=394098 RepID=UPI000693D851|nr:stage II sporulation protein R [Bhargavaea cecembensis]
MLTDYNIRKTASGKEKLRAAIPFIEFILMLLIVQCALFLLTGSGAEEEASMLRIRVIADSNHASAQAEKREVVGLIAPAVERAQRESRTPEELIRRLDAELPALIGGVSGEVRLEHGAALFPPKMFRGGVLPQQEADAWVVTIGSGRGDNWWCALFPDVCDPPKEEAKEAKAETEENEPVTFFIVEWLKGLFG